MVTLRDGRNVQLEEYGDPAGAPALWFHGASSSRLEGAFLDAPARESGLRLVALDRPGTGGSDPLPGRSVTGYATDVVEVLDALGLERAAVGGLSNGGMYAMAIGFEIPARVLRVVPVNPTTPVADAAAKAALSFGARMTYSFMARKPDLVARRAATAAAPGRFAAAVARRTNPDAHVFENPATAAAWATNSAEVRRQPDSGYVATEIAMATAPWGFDHRAVSVPVSLVSGEKDAGLGYAEVWARELPQGRLVVVPGGHNGMLAPDVARRVADLLCGRP
ncbi:alpha/beta fold hydrolase [Cryptosporangium sp. NPDC051539]|uniref:alpha/beta fold hydrolase n=1 Tax=Cryptosporangium sp. NPDC051539 TaxID=3363962 RepID=UPI0037AC70CB